MITLKLTDTYNLIVLEQDDHGDFASDDEGNVYLEINGRTHSDWKGYLASEIGEDEANSICDKLGNTWYNGGWWTSYGKWDSALDLVKDNISQALKSAGFLLKDGERPENAFLGPTTLADIKRQQAWDAAIPLSNIIIVEK